MSMWNEDGETEASANGHIQLASDALVSVGSANPADDGSMLALMVRSSQALKRDPKTLIERAKQIGGLLGSSGFYRFPAGGSNVQGPSIDMAQALAQEWKSIVYQVRIVHTESLASGGQRVHLRASVADMCSLVCAEVDQVVTTAPPPGKFADKVEQRERWNGMQVQSASSKIVRNAILRILPAWYVDPAFDAACAVDSKQALGGKTLPEARKGAVNALQEFGCTAVELEAFLNQPADMWAVPQIGALRELYAALKSGAQSVEAWRAGLNGKSETGSAAPRKSALGLSATSSAQTLDVVDSTKAKAKEPAKKEKPADAKPEDKPAESATREPGDDDGPVPGRSY
jgi:hypothetical protein